MKLASDYLKNKGIRSAAYVIEFWNEIEQSVIFNLGMFNYLKLTCVFDNDEISIFIYDSNNRVIYSKEKVIKSFKNNLFLSTDITFDINIIFIKSQCFFIDKEDINYYYTLDNKDFYYVDDGTILYLCKVCLSLDKIQDFIYDFLLDITREMQYACHFIFYRSNIRDNKRVDFDVKVEQIKLLTQLNNKTFIENLEEYKEVIKLSEKEINVINFLLQNNQIV